MQVRKLRSKCAADALQALGFVVYASYLSLQGIMVPSYYVINQVAVVIFNRKEKHDCRTIQITLMLHYESVLTFQDTTTKLV